MALSIPVRPSSVTILAVLLIALGIIEVVTGLLLGIAFALPGLAPVVALVGVPAIFMFLLPVLAVLWMVFALFSFIFAYAVWSGRRWSWVATLVFTTNSLTVAGFGLLIGSLGSLIPMAAIGLVLIALAMPYVRWYLNHARAPPPAYVIPPLPVAPVPTPGYAPSTYMPQPTVRPVPSNYPGAWAGNCPSCGAQVYPGATYCTSCQTRLR